MRKWPVIGVALAALWVFVRGATLAPATVLGEFLIGLFVGLPIAFAFRGFYAPQTALVRDVRVLPYAVFYLLVFTKELLTGSLDVAYRVLVPSMPIEPDVVAVPLRVESDAAITTIANSITLTPGTLTMDHDAAENTLYVHGITGRNREALLAPIRTWEDYALVIFDEDARPGDAAPPAGGETGGD
jgi:multicomponent Na+:H+ antiporter subunit E